VWEKKRVGKERGGVVANPLHVKLLKQGAAVWNEWRIKNIGKTPDLSGINLREHGLAKGPKLTGCNFCGADLIESNLDGAILNAVIFSGAYLMGATMIATDLRSANLGGPYTLWDGNKGHGYVGCILTNTDLSHSKMAYNNIANTDLSSVLGLDTVVHHAPSALDIETIYKSKGKIPESFLRGCGVPEDFIKLIPSLTSQPFQFYSCFISYSSQDDDFARRLHSDLQSNKVRVWFAPEDMKIGDKILERLDHSIRIHDKLLLVLSEQSIDSDWVEDEVTTAFEEERRRKKTVLFPIRLDNAVMDTNKAWAAKMRQRHIGDFTGWKNHDSYKKAFDRLLRDLKASEE